MTKDVKNFTTQQFDGLINWRHPIRAPKPPRKTYVYLILIRYCGDERYYLKIGHSYDPKKRIYQFSDRESWPQLLAQIEMPSKEEACKLELFFVKKFRRYLAFSREYFFVSHEIQILCKQLGLKPIFKNLEEECAYEKNQH